MKLFHKLFSSSKAEENEKVLPWISLEDSRQLQAIKEQSKTKPQIIFKHSTRCGISRMVIKQFESSYNLNEDQVDLYFLDLLSYRDISNEIAQQFQVLHESPQLLVVKDEIVEIHDSHGAINDIDLSQLV